MVISLLTGADPRQILAIVGLVQQAAPQATEQRVPESRPPADDPQSQFVRVILKDTEDIWTRVLAEQGRAYEKPTLVLFEERVDSACGLASSAVGPFYCPADNNVYLDLAFFRELSQRFGAPGDFARAYVIAHEIGHHVQNLLGVSDQVARAQQRAGSRQQANEYSVRLELQADCFAGRLRPLRQAVPRAGRRGGGPAGGGGDRRRHPAAAVRRQRGARVVDARLVGHARPLAAPRAGERRPQGVRHLPGASALRRLGVRHSGLDRRTPICGPL